MRNSVSTDAPPFFQRPYCLITQAQRESKPHIPINFIQKFGVSSEAPQYLRSSNSPVVKSVQISKARGKRNPNLRNSSNAIQQNSNTNTFDINRSLNDEKLFRIHSKRHNLIANEKSQISELLRDIPIPIANTPAHKRQNSRSEDSFNIKRGLFSYDPILQHNVITRIDKGIKGKLERQINNYERIYRNKSVNSSNKSHVNSPTPNRQDRADYRVISMNKNSITSFKVVLNPSDKSIRNIKRSKSKSPNITLNEDIKSFEKMLDSKGSRLPPITQGNLLQIYDKTTKMF